MKKVILSAVMACITTTAFADVNLYTSRKDYLLAPLTAQFTKETGIKVNIKIDGESQLIEAISAEGINTQADLFMTQDVGALTNAANRGLLAKLNSKAAKAVVAKELQTDYWSGLSVRARTIVYNADKVKPEEVASYAALGNSNFKNRVCLRTAKKVYNQSMVAGFIATYGEQVTEKMVGQWVANLATQPYSDDTLLIKNIDAGACDVGIVNAHYLYAYSTKNPESKVKASWVPADKGGVAVNLTGIAVTKYGKNRVEAERFVEWLLSDSAQKIYVEQIHEWPISKNVKQAEVMPVLSTLKQNRTVLTTKNFDVLQMKATMLMDRVGYR